jgi:predicted XRE-type DNA-binding protein
MHKRVQVERSSGNVFTDLGLPNPEEHLAKATIALAIARTIRERGLTQEQAGAVLGLTQPKVSDLVRGRLDKLTLDRLMRYLCKLDYDVTIRFAPKLKSRGEAVIYVEGAGAPAITDLNTTA